MTQQLSVPVVITDSDQYRLLTSYRAYCGPECRRVTLVVKPRRKRGSFLGPPYTLITEPN